MLHWYKYYVPYKYYVLLILVCYNFNLSFTVEPLSIQLLKALIKTRYFCRGSGAKINIVHNLLHAFRKPKNDQNWLQLFSVRTKHA